MISQVNGERHVLELVDHRAATDPDRPCYSISNHVTDASQGWRDVSYRDYANAINRLAHHIVAKLGRRSDSDEAIAYIGPNDMRYPIIVLAAMKAGYTVLLISPRNPLQGQLSLFSATSTRAFFYAPEYMIFIESIINAIEIPSYKLAPEREWLDPTPIEHIPYAAGTFDDWAFKPAFILHTSGSTGIPKPVVIRHGCFSAYERMRDLVSKTGAIVDFMSFEFGARMLISMPLFHAAGILNGLMRVLIYDMVMVLMPPGVPVTTDTVRAVLDHAGANCGTIAPSTLEDLSVDSDALAKLAKWSAVHTGGGPASTQTAQRLQAAGVWPVNIIGATEGFFPILRTKPEEFPLFHFDDEIGGSVWKKVPSSDGEELYELWCKRLPDSRSQTFFYTFPELDEYNTQDIYRPVPGKPGFWRYYARSDDVIVFSNGEKLNPVDIEGALTAHPSVKGALVVGQAQFQAAVLIEPTTYPKDKEDADKLIDEIWPIINTLNEATETHGQILKRFIRLNNPDKPFPRAGKGTIQRKGANALYKQEIEEIYAHAGDDVSSGLELSLDSEQELAQSILDAFVRSFQGRAFNDLSLDLDIFSMGVNSMQVLTIARSLKRSLDVKGVKVDPMSITPRAIYSHSTPRRIGHAIWSQLHSDSGPNGVSAQSTDTNVATLEGLVRRFTVGLPSVTPTATPAPRETYLITGTTGALGPYLLQQALRSPSARIFAVNRDPAAAQRQTEAHLERGLDSNFERVAFLTADYSKSNFGFNEDVLHEIRETTTRIIHNAWPVNFNIPVEAFMSSIASVRHLVDLAAKSKYHPHITFVSTIGTAMLQPSPVEEAPLPLAAAAMGYGHSKAVSAAILDEAREKGIESAIVRCGQIAGPLGAKGQWNKKEWFPSLVQSSAGLGVLPDSLGQASSRIDWLPVDTVAATIFDVSTARAQGHYHAVNPTPAGFSDILPAMSQYFGERVKTISFQAWLERLQEYSKTATSDTEVENVPGVKLLEFYSGMAQAREPQLFETTRTEEVSQSLREIGAVSPAWMSQWLEQWDY